ncbi:hypothetical protein J40TS1_31590 [Paenibacillus montaniterrae]|uniref:DinB-like domain-containing protein n=1 Tax=Paenibacillus montaniterrae TaxID=429341 RepID=A0A919YQN2_9BACL|nr:DinB family protein [Paenibacillus montaniterrae]GIP17517.1 hypothetical protein J40TS1_31590 [Paenibacillus montaniterrae]
MNEMKVFVQISRARMLHHYYPKIIRCVELLSEEEIWEIEPPFDHSIGGIVEHIRLHIERNIARLDNSEIRFEKGIEKSFDQRRLSKEIFISSINEVFIVLDKKLENSDSGMYDIYHLVEHTGYHVGQIVDRTKRLKGKVFDFVSEGINETNLKEKLKDDFE